MKYYLLASGSGGNCSIFENNEGELLMIDCGLAIHEIKKRMEMVGLSFENVKKVIITHMHSDHCLSIRAFTPSDVYVNVATGMSEFQQYDYYQTLQLVGFELYVLPASHDSAGTSGFLIQYNHEKVAYLTDTGYIHENIQRIINNCDAYLIESNHDPRMLMLTKRPAFLKQRILGANGHLSNQDCAYVLGNVMGPKTKEVVFIHRSQEANSEDMIYETFLGIMQQMKVDISSLHVSIAKQDIPVVYGCGKILQTN